MKPRKNGFILRVELLHEGRYLESYHTDLYKCPLCGREVCSGFGRGYHDPEGHFDLIVYA